MPSYLVDMFGFSNTSSILATVVLAIFSLVVVWLAGKLHTLFFKNEVGFAFLIFVLSALSGTLLYIFFDLSVVLSIVLMMLINGCMHGINLMLISYVPKRFSHYGNISTISGCINSCTYIGSAIATYGIAKLSEGFGWQITVTIWFAIALAGTVCCLIAMPKWKKFIEE
jgi:OPA family glycerol-3-phosphate transporter-like MFS transporter